MRLLGACTLALTLVEPIASAQREQASDSWRDPSPHAVQFVAVAPGIRLEVLDWRGTGRPIVFVGCYLTAHVYDNIAPKLTQDFRVVAITRRGIGASSQPRAGYGPERRADDVLAVIDALQLERPILVGSSCGGDILHTLGARNPDRLGGLVYFDAAEDPTLTATDYEVPLVAHPNMPARVPGRGPAPFPEAETRQQVAWPLDADIRRAIVEDNRVKPGYARIRVPVVAIYRMTTLQEALKEYPPRNDLERTAVEQTYAALRAMVSKWQRDLLAGVPTATIIELNADAYMFLSNEADVVKELRAFAFRLP